MLSRPQKYLHTPGLIILIVLLTIVAPMSTDMYLPSMPTMADEFCVSTTELNFTLISYNLFTTLGMIIIGPLSDKYGRKKPLIVTTLMFLITCLLIFFVKDLGVMTVERAIQGFGAGGMISISTAIVKDSFSEKSRGVTLSIVQAMSIIGPIIAPIIGAAIIVVLPWNYVFMFLSIFGIIILIFVFLYQETIPKEEIITKNIIYSYSGTISVFKNKSFMLLLMFLAFVFAPFMAYISSATYIYQIEFSCNPQEFTMFFTIASISSIAGTLYSMCACKKRTKKSSIALISIDIALCLLSAILILTIGKYGPIIFLCCFIIYFVSNSFLRPFTIDILLNQHTGDTGSATAVLNFVLNLFGTFGMIVGSIALGSYVLCLGTIMFACFVVALFIWIYINKSNKIQIKL